MRERPPGITVLAILALLSGLVAVWFAVELFAAANDASILAFDRLANAARLLALVSLVVGVLDLVFAWGALRLRGWAWQLGVVLEVLSILLNLLRVGRGFPGSHFAAMVLGLIVLWYLFRPETRRAFEA